MSTGTWTQRDLDILDTLAIKVRVMTLAQIAAGWWEPSPHRLHNARRRISGLVRAGLLLRYPVTVHPLLSVTAPIFRWRPGEPPPDCGRIAWQLQHRWTTERVTEVVYLASPRTAHLFGSYAGRLPKAHDLNHDLLLAQVYLWYCRTQPEVARAWRGESCFRKAGHGIKDPDALVYNARGECVGVIESGGHYPARRVAAFHAHCHANALRYELW